MSSAGTSGNSAEPSRPRYSSVGHIREIREVREIPSIDFEQVAKADPDNIQEVAASQLNLSSRYYESVLLQARQSFRVALVSAAVGSAFFLAAVVIAIVEKNLNAATISSIGGAIVETISGLNFWLYGRTASQLDVFHIRLEQTQRYLLAFSMSRSLPEKDRQGPLSELIKTVSKSGNNNSLSKDSSSDKIKVVDDLPSNGG